MGEISSLCFLRRLRELVMLALAVVLVGCNSFSYTNARLISAIDVSRVSMVMPPGTDRGNHRVLMILALSGGGSRAAYWSGNAMLKLSQVFSKEGLDILKEVDVISSVSGGSLPAAYYAISRDENVSDNVHKRVWNEGTVRNLMSRSYLTRLFLNFYWPANIFRYWFTAFDRSDIMSQVFADNLFDDPVSGYDYSFGDVNPERPLVLINATQGSESVTDARGCGLPENDIKMGFGQPFIFSGEFFRSLCSNLGSYSIARAVMASAAFPAVFPYMTLKNYSASGGAESDRFTHIFDGGNYDNLGLSTAQAVIEKNMEKYDGIIVILVDAYTNTKGRSNAAYDGRDGFSYVIDTNFLDSFDSLLNRVRQDRLRGLAARFRKEYSKNGKRGIFYHVKFDNLPQGDRLLDKLDAIPTSFNLSDDGKAAIDKFSDIMFVPENTCLRRIKALVEGDLTSTEDPWCTYDLNSFH